MDADAPLTVSQPVTVELIDATGAAIPIQAELGYDAADPYAVTAVFITQNSQVCWTFARDLLSGGLYEPSGDGDVHVWPSLEGDGSAVVIIELCSPGGETLVQAKARDLSHFVAQTRRIVAVGDESEHINIDAAIDAVLADAAWRRNG